MKVAIAFSPKAGAAVEWTGEVPEGATAMDAIRASGVLEGFPEIDVGAGSIGVWGRVCAAEMLLKEGDRVELYRPLAMDPNEARRLRAKQLRAKKRA